MTRLQRFIRAVKNNRLVKKYYNTCGNHSCPYCKYRYYVQVDYMEFEGKCRLYDKIVQQLNTK